MLMAHVDAVSAITRHDDVAAVLARGLSLLYNLAIAPANRVPLMAHVGMVLSAMVRHADSDSDSDTGSGELCKCGVC